jgi:hypothetical protein
MALSKGVSRLTFVACFVAGFLLPYVSLSLPSALSSAHEVQRIVAPDGQADAVAVITQTGLLKSRAWYEVYVVRRGARFARVPPVFSGLEMEGPALIWAAPRLLEVHYSRALIENFRNSRKLSNDNSIEIRLVPTSHNFSYLNESGLKPSDSQ